MGDRWMEYTVQNILFFTHHFYFTIKKECKTHRNGPVDADGPFFCNGLHVFHS